MHEKMEHEGLDLQGQSIQGPPLAACFAQFCTSQINSGPG